jgi:hypothetical protein
VAVAVLGEMMLPLGKFCSPGIFLHQSIFGFSGWKERAN